MRHSDGEDLRYRDGRRVVSMPVPRLRVPSDLVRRGFAACVIVASVASVGCTRRAGKVEPDTARQALRTTLEAWQQKKAPADLQTASPAIVVRDPDWTAGRRLASFEVLQEEDDTLNLRAKVRLVLEDDKGQPKEQEVFYTVGTSPVVTVFREEIL